MLSYIAYLMAQESSERQFLSGPSCDGHSRAAALSWRSWLSVRVWAQPLAAALRGAAERLEALAPPEGSAAAPMENPRLAAER
jgi:hypothetical protein